MHNVKCITSYFMHNLKFIKYRATISTGDIKNTEIFMEKNSVAKGIIVTKDLFREEKSLVYIPAWVFLLSYETLIE